MNFLELSEEYLKDAERWFTYDKNIPFQYRVMAKLLYDNIYSVARRIIEANANDFAGEYSYLILDYAVEACINEVIDENGKLCKSEKEMTKYHIYKPTQKTIEFIHFLLENGANPHLPERFNQLEHIDDVEEDSMQQTELQFDCSEIKQLLSRYM